MEKEKLIKNSIDFSSFSLLSKKLWELLFSSSYDNFLIILLFSFISFLFLSYFNNSSIKNLIEKSILLFSDVFFPL